MVRYVEDVQKGALANGNPKKEMVETRMALAAETGDRCRLTEEREESKNQMEGSSEVGGWKMESQF